MRALKPVLNARSILGLSAAALVLAACGGSGQSATSAAPVAVTPPPPPAPPPEPEKVRYVDHTFEAVDITEGIAFGENLHEGIMQTLRMDIYTPAGDSETDRPVIILAFGGDFGSGNRTNNVVTNMAHDYARRGFVTASIDYRLKDREINSQDDFDITVIRAAFDMKAAVRFFREDAKGADTYGTRADAIFVGGVSSGALAATSAGMMDASDGYSANVREYIRANGGYYAGNSSANTQISAGVQGIVSVSGAVPDFLWGDEYSAPIFAAHEELDRVIPCEYAMGQAGVFMAGGCEMTKRAREYGVRATLLLAPNSSDHLGYSKAGFKEIYAGSARFLSGQIPKDANN